VSVKEKGSSAFEEGLGVCAPQGFDLCKRAEFTGGFIGRRVLEKSLELGKIERAGVSTVQFGGEGHACFQRAHRCRVFHFDLEPLASLACKYARLGLEPRSLEAQAREVEAVQRFGHGVRFHARGSDELERVRCSATHGEFHEFEQTHAWVEDCGVETSHVG
jgi:hypothetical protein